MNFYSGFCLKGEEVFFKEFIKEGEYVIAGFSMGAIDAFEFALKTKKRVDLIQLFSPAFFMNKSKSFKRAQLHYFKRNKNDYVDNFLKNAAFASNIDLKAYYKEDGANDLDRLLNFIWIKSDLQKLVDRGVKIEIFLGEKDKIIDPVATRDFFREFATVYFIKNRGHLLHG